jgi:hypothetical protein
MRVDGCTSHEPDWIDSGPADEIYLPLVPAVRVIYLSSVPRTPPTTMINEPNLRGCFFVQVCRSSNGGRLGSSCSTGVARVYIK